GLKIRGGTGDEIGHLAQAAGDVTEQGGRAHAGKHAAGDFAKTADPLLRRAERVEETGGVTVDRDVQTADIIHRWAEYRQGKSKGYLGALAMAAKALMSLGDAMPDA